MSKISISAAIPSDSVQAAKLIHDVTRVSLASARERLKKGKRGVFYCAELFLNDHLERDGEIRRLVSGLEDLGLELFVMEITHDQLWENVNNHDEYRISTRELISLLDNCESYE